MVSAVVEGARHELLARHLRERREHPLVVDADGTELLDQSLAAHRDGSDHRSSPRSQVSLSTRRRSSRASSVVSSLSGVTEMYPE